MRVLRPWFASGQADSYKAPNYNWWSLDSEWKTDDGVFYNEHFDPRREDAGDFARRVAEESHVLLKNKGGVLPISDKVRRIGVFGTDADYPTTMSGCGMDLFCMEGSNIRHWNGTITVGGGSGAAYGAYIVPPIEAISRRARASSIRVDQVLRDDEEHYPAIRKVASSVELCLVFVGVFLVEGSDRAALKLDNDGEKLILQVADACGGDVVVVMHAGAQVVVEEWVHHPRVKGVIFAGYPGQESGNALVNVLWGDVDASGRLAFTMGKKEEDWPTKNIIRKPVSRG